MDTVLPRDVSLFVFKSGNNGPGILGGAEGGPSDPGGWDPRGGQTPPWLDICTMDKDLREDDSEYSLGGPGAPTSMASTD